MYIFQTGKKLGKRVSGVENFQESEKLVMEAYKAMLRDQNKKRRSYDYEGMMTNPKRWKTLTAKAISTCSTHWKALPFFPMHSRRSSSTNEMRYKPTL